jgi:hypothetical protein
VVLFLGISLGFVEVIHMAMVGYIAVSAIYVQFYFQTLNKVVKCFMD